MNPYLAQAQAHAHAGYWAQHQNLQVNQMAYSPYVTSPQDYPQSPQPYYYSGLQSPAPPYTPTGLSHVNSQGSLSDCLSPCQSQTCSAFSFAPVSPHIATSFFPQTPCAQQEHLCRAVPQPGTLVWNLKEQNIKSARNKSVHLAYGRQGVVTSQEQTNGKIKVQYAEGEGTFEVYSQLHWVTTCDPGPKEHYRLYEKFYAGSTAITKRYLREKGISKDETVLIMGIGHAPGTLTCRFNGRVVDIANEDLKIAQEDDDSQSSLNVCSILSSREPIVTPRRAGEHDENQRLTGTCKCEQVQFFAQGSVLFSGLCHCADCNRSCGSTPVHLIALPTVGITKGDVLETGNDEISRIRCANCLSLISQGPTNGSWRAVTPASVHLCVDESNGYSPNDLAPTMHLSYGQRSIDYNDTLPKYSQFGSQCGEPGQGLY